MKPLIGIGADVGTHVEMARDRTFVWMTYVEAVRRAGGIPLLIPPQPENLDELVEELDGVVLTGGRDCDPLLYAPEQHPSVEPMDARRQENDLAIARIARQTGTPVLGICLGVQLMNVEAGGTLIQDIASAVETDIRHESELTERARHEVDVVAGTRLAAILGQARLEVNSSHHQAVDAPGEGLVVTASAPDGIVEALEDPSHVFYVGVQWHPEDMPGDKFAGLLFAAFIAAAARRAAQRRSLRAE